MSETPTGAIETMMEPVAPEAPWWTALKGLPQLMKALAVQRQNVADADQVVKSAQAILEETLAYKNLAAAKQLQTETSATLMALDAAVRKAALDEFKANGEKAVFAGVSVKMYTRFDYDAAQLRAWAIEQKVFGLLTLDTKRTEKAAAAGVLENAPIVVSKEARVQIATDLTAYLAQ
jgi:hypothetical protein